MLPLGITPDRTTIERLVENRVAESTWLDFKESLHVGSDRERREFLKDICAFANSGGGHIVVGIQEDTGEQVGQNVAARIVGAPALHPDRLTSIARDCIQPSLPQIQIHSVACEPGSVYVIEIPRSWATPHMVVRDQSQRFYRRLGATSEIMDIDHIREAFRRSGRARDEIDQHYTERLDALLPQLIPSAQRESFFAVHAYPASGLRAYQVDPNQLTATEKPLSQYHAGNYGNLGYQFNYDGIIFQDFVDQRVRSHMQFYRSGAVEGLVNGVTYEGKRANELCLNALYVLHMLRRFVHDVSLMFEQRLQIHDAILVRAIVGRAQHAKIEPDGMAPNLTLYGPLGTDRLVLPEIVLDGATPASDSICRPPLDVLWQSGGHPRCPNFDEEGVFQDPS